MGQWLGASGAIRGTLERGEIGRLFGNGRYGPLDLVLSIGFSDHDGILPFCSQRHELRYSMVAFPTIQLACRAFVGTIISLSLHCSE